MKTTILILFCILMISCTVHRIPVITETDIEPKAVFSIGILNCNNLNIDQSERIFTKDDFNVDFVQILQNSKLFTEVKCVDINDEDVDFLIEAKQLLKITEDNSCGLDNQMLMTIGTLGLISTGCTTIFHSSLLATDSKSRKQLIIDYKHNEDRRNGIFGFLSESSEEWTDSREPFPLDTYYKKLALEIYNVINMSDRTPNNALQ